MASKKKSAWTEDQRYTVVVVSTASVVVRAKDEPTAVWEASEKVRAALLKLDGNVYIPKAAVIKDPEGIQTLIDENKTEGGDGNVVRPD